MRNYLTSSGAQLDESIRIKNVGLSLPKNDHWQIKNALIELQSLAPANSHISLTFTQLDSGVHGEVKVNSLSKKFKSEYNGSTPLTVFFALELDLKNQIKEWKKTRFLVSSKSSQTNFLNPKENMNENKRSQYL